MEKYIILEVSNGKESSKFQNLIPDKYPGTYKEALKIYTETRKKITRESINPQTDISNNKMFYPLSPEGSKKHLDYFVKRLSEDKEIIDTWLQEKGRSPTKEDIYRQVVELGEKEMFDVSGKDAMISLFMWGRQEGFKDIVPDIYKDFPNLRSLNKNENYTIRTRVIASSN